LNNLERNTKKADNFSWRLFPG